MDYVSVDSTRTMRRNDSVIIDADVFREPIYAGVGFTYSPEEIYGQLKRIARWAPQRWAVAATFERQGQEGEALANLIAGRSGYRVPGDPSEWSLTTTPSRLVVFYDGPPLTCVHCGRAVQRRRPFRDIGDAFGDAYPTTVVWEHMTEPTSECTGPASAECRWCGQTVSCRELVWTDKSWFRSRQRSGWVWVHAATQNADCLEPHTRHRAEPALVIRPHGPFD